MDGGCRSDPDFSVGLLMGIDYRTRALYVIDVVRERLSPANLERRIVSASTSRWRTMTIRSRRTLAQVDFTLADLASKLQGRSINIEPEQKSKEARAAPFASQCENGMVKLLRVRGFRGSLTNCAPSQMALMTTRWMLQRPLFRS